MARSNKNNIGGSEFWLNSENLSFKEILIGSRIPEKWSKFNLIEDYYKDFIIKPVNRYVSNLYPKPEIVSINNNTIRLRQKTHAEIWVKPRNEVNVLYALDKTWQRQFYPSNIFMNNNSCFAATYKFYIPWIIDRDLNAKIEQVLDEKTCFIVDPCTFNFWKTENEEYINTGFINFQIKREGSHMLDDRYGIIDIGTPMYDVIFTLDNKDMEIFYEQYRR